jgi:hypothetical protein
MSEILWFGGLLFASLWGSSHLPTLQAWDADRIRDRIAEPSDARTPILPPIKPGERPHGESPPTRQEILRAMPKVPRGIPFIYEESRDNLEFTAEKMFDRLEPPRYFPLIGLAQLHRCHWKCTVYFTENIEVSHPFPFREKTRREEIVYLDKDRLHLCENQPDDASAKRPEAPASCPGGHFSGKQIYENVGGAEASQEPPAGEPRTHVLPTHRKTSVPASTMTLAEIVLLSKHADAEDIIIRQIELTTCVFHLTTQDLLYLLEQGVRPRVVRAMQESGAGAKASSWRQVPD